MFGQNIFRNFQSKIKIGHQISDTLFFTFDEILVKTYKDFGTKIGTPK